MGYLVRLASAVEGERVDIPLAVNGTLMRGLELNGNLTAVGARFLRDASTVAEYRLWSIGDRHPAMLARPRRRRRDRARGVERAGGGTRLAAARRAPGSASARSASRMATRRSASSASRSCARGSGEITTFGGWRAYVAARATT